MRSFFNVCIFSSDLLDLKCHTAAVYGICGCLSVSLISRISRTNYFLVGCCYNSIANCLAEYFYHGQAFTNIPRLISPTARLRK